MAESQTTTSPQIPEMVEGGCLCGGVRYRVDFKPDHDWKRGPHTCQCTQCRKNCGSLVYTSHLLSGSEITWLSQTTYTEYNSSPGCYRSFCTKCGSSLAWINRSTSTDIFLATGTVDEKYLVGERDDEDNGVGGYGIALAAREGEHYHVRNEIRGVTETLTGPGTRFWNMGRDDGPLPKETVVGFVENTAGSGV